MRNIVLLLYTLLGLLPSRFLAQIAWQEIPPPSGRSLPDLCVLNDKVFSVEWNGKLKCLSSADLSIWEVQSELTPGSTFGNVKLLTHGNRLYLFAWNETEIRSNLFYSDDEAKSWTELPLPANDCKRFILVGNAFLTASENAVFKSAGPAQGWSKTLQIQEGILDLNFVGATAVAAVTATTLYISSDNGEIWLASVPPYQVNGLMNPQIRIFPTEFGGYIRAPKGGSTYLFRSVDEGKNWNIYNPKPPFNTAKLVDLQSNESELWAVVDGKIARSKDLSLTWNYIHCPSKTTNIVLSGDTILAAGEYGFFKSFDLSNTWYSGNLNLSGAADRVEALSASEEKLFFVSESGLYSTENEGKEWRLIQNSEYISKSSVIKGDTILFCGSKNIRSFDGGQTWKNLDIIASGFALFEDWDATVALTGKYLFYFSFIDQVLLYSETWGDYWQQAPLSGFSNYQILGTPSHLFIISLDGILSKANGSVFLNDNPPSGLPLGLWVAGPDAFTHSDGKFYRKEFSGWKQAGTDLWHKLGYQPDIKAILGENNRKTLVGFANDKHPQVLISENRGDQWGENIAAELPDLNTLFACLKGTDAMYLAGNLNNSGACKIWRRDISVGAGEPVSSDFELVPNPARRVCTIRAVSGKNTAQDLEVEMFDLHGKHVVQSTLHSVSDVFLLQWPADLPEGLYFLQIKTHNGSTAAKKIVILGD